MPTTERGGDGAADPLLVATFDSSNSLSLRVIEVRFMTIRDARVNTDVHRRFGTKESGYIIRTSILGRFGTCRTESGDPSSRSKDRNRRFAHLFIESTVNQL
jgi:hypothetical protein